ncbi:serine carboxypeptidase S28 family protein [Actinidia rufa]|uniref:Serine carboxypeptidase S28 family protein n=1 Tax=Actinidia rufa TaxID=165716 RepID=A0A7J0HBC8_9ERIC|nr:serine carboxypeptidase S28 family protein [Actinidia rufa]
MVPLHSILALSLLILHARTCVIATYPKTAFGVVGDSVARGYDPNLPPEFVTYYYTQTLDHFNYKPESYNTFQQRYIMNTKYWGGANSSSPIFVYTGDESGITVVAAIAGFMVELASHFNGLLVYIEHRYYGESVPFGSKEEAFKNSSTLGFFSSEQALADYAQLIIDVKKNLSAHHSPVFALGGSYGGRSHCLDLLTPTANDPDWLVAQRDTEIKIMEGWIANYNA